MRRLLIAAVAAATLATPVAAHRGHSGLTVVEIDGAKGMVTVTHRLHAHDIEPKALVSIAPEAQPTLDDPAAMRALNAHLGERFSLEADGQRVALTHVGTDRAGDRLRARFSGAFRPDPRIDRVRVDLDFFPGVHDDQEFQVNVRSAGVTRTVVFRPGSAAQTVAF